MFGVLYARPNKLHLLSHHLPHLHHQHRPFQSPLHFSDDSNRLRHHSTNCRLSAASSIWHVIQPRRRKGRVRGRRLGEARGEGSWNVAWDARPARWLQRADSAWVLFGVCACVSRIQCFDDEVDSNSSGRGSIDEKSDGFGSDYKVTGVVADGRCLFRAIAHGACLRNGEEPPDHNRETLLADQLRAQVVDELLKRRNEIQWSIEEDFDEYISRIQKPYVWGGEPELLMASHIIKTMISVFMIDRKSSNLVNIANYGEEYKKDEVNPINVLFHGYGHYDILETSDQCHQKLRV